MTIFQTIMLEFRKIQLSYLHGKNNTNKIITICEKLKTKGMSNYFIEIMLAWSYYSEKKYIEAGQIADQMFKVHGYDKAIYELLVLANYQLGNQSVANEYFGEMETKEGSGSEIVRKLRFIREK